MTVVKNMTVEDIMTKDIVTVNHNSNLLVVAEIFDNNSFHHLLVLKEGELVGMISEGDILIMKDWGTRLNLDSSKKINHSILRSHLAEELMNSSLITVKHDDSVKQLIELMRSNKYHAYPVFKSGKLVGMVTSFDIIHKAIQL